MMLTAGIASPRLRAALLRGCVFVVFAIAWQVYALERDNILIASFTETASAVIQLVTANERFWGAFVDSNRALAIGFAISVAVGVPLGLLMARSRGVEAAVYPWLNVVNAVPIAPLIPIVIMAVGLDLSAKVLVVVLFSFVFIAVNTRAGVRSIEPALIEMAHSFGCSESQVWRKVLIPGAAPAIMVGLRVGLGRAVTAMVIVEILLTATGLGKLMLEFQGFFQPDRLFATVLLVIFESIVLMALMNGLSKRLLPWAVETETA
jgi:ABC-type nitrate/sulfonate/bicarbonate transport system permease component